MVTNYGRKRYIMKRKKQEVMEWLSCSESEYGDFLRLFCKLGFLVLACRYSLRLIQHENEALQWNFGICNRLYFM